jgi:hypothetical protein
MLLLLGDVAAQPQAAAYKPEGEMRWALYVTLAPAWFDPGEVANSSRLSGSSTPSTTVW